MSRAIIPEALKWLNITGLNIMEEKFYLRGYIMIVVSSVCAVLELLEMLFNFSNIDVVAGVIEVFAPVYLSLIKIMMMAIHRKTLSSINHNIISFWPTSMFGSELENELEYIFVTVKTMLSGYRWLAMTTTTMIIPLKPILTGESLPIDIWQPIDLMVPPYYYIIYFLESCVGYFASLVNIAIDSLYVGYVTHLISQFMLLKKGFTTIDIKHVETMEGEDICLGQMKKYVQHNNLLLDMIEDIQVSHSIAFFNVVGTGILAICIDLYSAASANGELDILRMVKYVFQCSFFVFLLFAYCFTANHLTDQCLSVSDAVYESEWYCKPVPRLRKGVILIIQRAQITTKLTAGGLVTLDLENFVRLTPYVRWYHIVAKPLDMRALILFKMKFQRTLLRLSFTVTPWFMSVLGRRNEHLEVGGYRL
ncbi:Odorant receptor 22c [Carabus blaptoides fortunei]